MSFAIFGLNHKTAPVALREKVAFSPQEQADVLFQLKNHPLIDGVFLISTCNRMEIYLSIDDANKNLVQQYIKKWLCHYHQFDSALFDEHFYGYFNVNAIQHLIRVCAGLDSLVLGEPQILGQIKDAYQQAKDVHSLNTESMKIVENAFRYAKFIRSETGIGTNSVSVASTVCQLIQQLNETTSDQVILLIGAGETIELIARYLSSFSFKKVIVANRTPAKALAVAKYLDAEIISLPEIASRLNEADIIISSTASPLPIIGKGMVERSLLQRNQNAMLFIDIAVPRDVEPEVATLSHVLLYSIDALQAIVNDNIVQRQLAAQEAEFLVHENALKCAKLLHLAKINEKISAYRDYATKMQKQLEKDALSALKNGQNPEKVVKKLSHLLSRRLMHFPTGLLRETLNTENNTSFQLNPLLGRDAKKNNPVKNK